MVKHFGVAHFVGVGVGLGANVLARFAVSTSHTALQTTRWHPPCDVKSIFLSQDGLPLSQHSHAVNLSSFNVALQMLHPGVVTGLVLVHLKR